MRLSFVGFTAISVTEPLSGRMLAPPSVSMRVRVQAAPARSKRYTPPLIVPAYSLVGEAKASDLILASRLSPASVLFGMDCQPTPKVVLIHGRMEPKATRSASAAAVGLPGLGGVPAIGA